MDDISSYFQFGRQERKLFFMDSRYPMLHLTVSWANPSGEIDVHLTRELPGGTKIYGSIVRIAETAVSDYLTSLLPRFEAEATSLVASFVQKVRPVRPGWLGRRGYMIFWVPEEEHRPWLMRFAERRGKNRYRVHPASLNSLNHAGEVIEHLYEPSILHELAAHGRRGWIQALRVNGRKRGRRAMISLTPVTWFDGRVRWIPIDTLAASAMERMGQAEDSIFKPLNKALSERLDKVYDELRLDELGIDRESFTSFNDS